MTVKSAERPVLQLGTQLPQPSFAAQITQVRGGAGKEETEPMALG